MSAVHNVIHSFAANSATRSWRDIFNFKQIFTAFFVVGVILLTLTLSVEANVEVEEVSLKKAGVYDTSSVVVEPSNPPITNEFTTIFRFKIRDTLGRRNDSNDVSIYCIRLQNLGSATNQDITDVRVTRQGGTPMTTSTSSPGQLPVPGRSTFCPPSASAGGPVSFEAFLYRGGGGLQSSSAEINHGNSATYSVAVKTEKSRFLRDNARNHSLQLQATVLYEEPADTDQDGRINEDLVDDDNDGSFDEDPIDNFDNDGKNGVDEDPPDAVDDDGDGKFDEDPVDFQNNDGDNKTDEDPTGGFENDDPRNDQDKDEDPINGRNDDPNNDSEIDEDPPNPFDSLGNSRVSLTDSQIDRIQNRGINSLHRSGQSISRSIPIPPQTQPQEPEVAKFWICDGGHSDPTGKVKSVDGNGNSLKLKEVIVRQGPSGTATAKDIRKLKLIGSGGQLTSPTPLPANSLARSGVGVTLTGGPITITDDKCEHFTLIAIASRSALRGRTLQPNMTAIVDESGLTFDQKLAPRFEVRKSSIIGSGIIRIQNRRIAGSDIGIEAVRVPNVGLKKLQTMEVQFNPDVIQVEGISPKDPYQTESVEIDNRSGKVRFNLVTSQPTKPIDPTNPVFTLANLEITPRGKPGTKSTLLLQVGQIIDGSGSPIGQQVVLNSGSVTLLAPGDVTMDSAITIKDVLNLAQQLISDCDKLNKEQRLVADVAGTVKAGDKAPDGKIPSCTSDEASAQGNSSTNIFEIDGQIDLNSADLRRIAELAILQEGNVSSSTQPSTRVKNTSSGWWNWLMRSLGLQQQNEATLKWAPSPQYAGSWELSASVSGASIGGFQGRIQYDPEELNVQKVQEINGYDVLASRIDSQRGEVRFLALAPQDSLTGSHRILRLVTDNSTLTASPQLQLRHLVDADGQSIAFKLQQDGPVRALQVSALELQHPSGDRWTLNVRGQGVQNVAVQGYDLGGRPRFHERSQGSQLEWRALDEQTGRPLANGVYLYRVTVEGVHGEIWRSDVRKLLVLR
ncbi:MAG: hypothetical protein ABEK03_10125 [Candidatus Bipolaricaulia bacterium]